MKETAVSSQQRRAALIHCDERGRTLYRYVAGELLVANEDVDSLVRTLATERAEPVREIAGMTVFCIPSGDDVPRVVARLQGMNRGVTVSPNHVHRPALHEWWGAHPPRPAEPLEDLPVGKNLAGSGVVIGALDTGLEPHEWFKGRARPAHEGDVDREEIDETGDGVVDREAGHGTHVAGIILQHAPGADVVVWGVRDKDGHLNDSAASEGILGLVRDHQVDVLNITFSAPGRQRGNAAIQRALEEARRINPKLVVVAAAGNRENDHDAHRLTDEHPPQFPAALKGVVSVGAVTARNAVASFSPRGDWVRSWSRGTNIASTFLTKQGKFELSSAEHGRRARTGYREFRGFAYWSGTSFATPRVSGAIAAAMSPPGQPKASAKDALRELGLDATGSATYEGPVINPRNFLTD